MQTPAVTATIANNTTQSFMHRVFSNTPKVLGVVCNRALTIVAPGGDYKDTCQSVSQFVAKRPYAVQLSLGTSMATLSVLSVRDYFRYTPAIKALDGARKEIEHLLTQVEKIHKSNDERIKIYSQLRALKEEISNQDTPKERRTTALTQITEISERYRVECNKLGGVIHETRKSIELKMNKEKETTAIFSLRKKEINGLKKHVRLGDAEQMPSDYLKETICFVTDSLTKLDDNFQTELNAVYKRSKEDNTFDDHFPDRQDYHNLHTKLYEALTDIAQTTNSLMGDEPSVWQHIKSKPYRTALAAVGFLAGSYLTIGSFMPQVAPLPAEL